MSEEKTVSRRGKTEKLISDKPKPPKTTAVKKAAKTAEPGTKPLTRPKAASVKKTAIKAEPGTGTVLKPKTTAQAKKPAKPTGSELAELVAAAAAEHKPIDPVLLNLSGLSSVADWFFVASAENPRQMEAIAEKIIRRARERGIRPLGHEGLGRGLKSPWVLVDLGDVVVHIFNLEARNLYDLEGLWSDALRHPAKT